MNMPAWIGRVLALALLGAVITLVYFVLLVPLRESYAATDRRIAEARELLTRLERLAASRPGLEAQVAELQARQSTQGNYLIGNTDALAAADLQERVNAIITGNGGTLRSIQVLPAEDESGFRRVAMRMQVTATTAALFNIVYALESETPLLFIDNFDVQARRKRRTTTEQDQQETILTIGLDLYGYLPAVPG
ncbi:MAG: type II secretion system protein GspM [Dongiaceae bacterium]